MAETVTDREEPAREVLHMDSLPGLLARLDRLQQQCEQRLRQQEKARVVSERFLRLRLAGTDTSLMIAEPDDRDFTRAFCDRYRREFGFLPRSRDILVDGIRVRTRGRLPRPPRIRIDRATIPPRSRTTVDCWFDDRYHRTPLYLCGDLLAGHRIQGPALMIQGTATIVIEPGCSARVTEAGDVEIRVDCGRAETGSRAADPVRLAIFGHLFMSIAEQMGRMLRKTAISTNIKERLDFSCALFDGRGRLVANAPHVPVHLGAMDEAVRAQIDRHPDLEPGDVLLANHPLTGGSHLPDITVMTPVFRDRTIVFWVASRGHHADIGGATPGSMPPFSRELSDEGTAIESFVLVRRGRFREEAIRALLAGSRRLDDNIADLRAQVAANRKGIDLINEMIDRYSLDTVQAYMAHIQKAAETAVRSELKKLAARLGLRDGDRIKTGDRLDDGSPIRLSLTIDPERGQAVFDFTGTGEEIWGNLNTPPAVTRSALLYCLRLLVADDIPLNHGCLRPVTLRIPAGSLLSPSPRAAVVGGNVLTSQRLVDVILKAFRAAAASQGCMNNLTFGDREFGYYETIGGGAGAGPGWHGQSGVHTHMTNTRITDPEILEQRYPVLVREFGLRRGSGGAGRFRGGDGLIRELEFLRPLEVSILSERRVFAPWGMAGGGAGKPGRNLWLRADGTTVNLGGKNQVRVAAGDRIRILTPGGGGYGEPVPSADGA